MNAWDRKNETCTPESGCATSFDKKSLSEKKNQSTVDIASSRRGNLAHGISTKREGPWSYREHRIFLDGLYTYGRDSWKQIAALVKSRNDEEVQRHFHSFRIKEAFLFTLRRMLDDKSLDHIIAWQPDGRTFRIYNQLTFVRVALLLYFGGFFCDYDHFQTELSKCGFYTSGLDWFNPLFYKISYTSSELASIKPISIGTSTSDNTSDQNTEVILEKSRQSKTLQLSECNNKFCNKVGNLMQCSGCRNVYYCCSACQISDWNFHKLVCGKGMNSNNETNGKGTNTSNNMGVSTKEVHDEPKQHKVNAIRASEIQKALKEETKTQVGNRWSAEEHYLLLEGLEQYGRSWNEIASHVKTRTYSQVRYYGNKYLKNIDCYWTTKEHQLFQKGLEKYGKGYWVEIASLVGTKDKKQVCFHAMEYFAKEEMHKESQKTTDSSDEHSPVASNLVKKPNHNPIYTNSRNAKRSRDQGEDSISTNSKKRKTMESTQQRNDGQTIVTPEKGTVVNKSMQNVDTTQSLKPIHQKTAVFQDRQKATCERSNYENEKKHDLRPLTDNAKKTISTTVYDTSCPICLEKFNDPHIVPECCHRFCKGCIDDALKYRRECPICRGRVTSRRSLRRDGLFAKLLRLLEVERAKGNTIVAPTLHKASANQLSDNTIVIDNNNQTNVGEKNETIGFAESIKEACTKEEGETRIQTEEEQIVRNEYNENTKFQLQQNSMACEHSETQLEEENSRMNILEKVRSPFDEKIKDLQTQLQQKNEACGQLKTQLEEKSSRIQKLENLVRTLSDEDKIKSMVAAVKDPQPQLRENNIKIDDLETQLRENNIKIQHLESKKKEETQIQTEEEHHVRNENKEAKRHGGNKKIQLDHDSKANEYLEVQLEEKKKRRFFFSFLHRDSRRS